MALGVFLRGCEDVLWIVEDSLAGALEVALEHLHADGVRSHRKRPEPLQTVVVEVATFTEISQSRPHELVGFGNGRLAILQINSWDIRFTQCNHELVSV